MEDISNKEGVAETATDFIMLNGVKYLPDQSQTINSGAHIHPVTSMHARARFECLVNELAEVCPGPAGMGHIDIPAGDDGPEQALGRWLETWNRSKPLDRSGASTPKQDHDGDSSSKVIVTLIFDSQCANDMDTPLGGRKIIHISQRKLERILGPETARSKLQEIRGGRVVLQDVLPTTFNAIRKWLSGKAIMHTLPIAVRDKPLRELVYIYVQAARWGHRSIVHDAVNNMPSTGTPFEFLEICAIVYSEGCAGVAFRNFFKKGLPVVLGNSTFDQTDKVPKVLKQSTELATDFAETMLGLVSQRKYGNHAHHIGPQPFPAFTARDPEPVWFQPPEPAFCACGLHECTCTSDTASVTRPSDTHAIPRRSGYVESASSSVMGVEDWSKTPPWGQNDGGAGWDYSHRPVPTGGIIPAPPMSIGDAEDQPIRPRNWSSAHLGQGSEWSEIMSANEDEAQAWMFEGRQDTPMARGRYRDEAAGGDRSPRVQFATPSRELLPISRAASAGTSIEGRLRVVERKLRDGNLWTHPTRQPIGLPPNNEEQSQSTRVSTRYALGKTTAPQGKVLATSDFPPAPLLHPGFPPVGMPNYVPRVGYNRYVQVGNGVVHPTGPGPYGLAGRSMIAVRSSNSQECTLVFQAGDTIECVIPVEESRSTSQHNPWNFSDQRLQGICRTQAGSFPASYVREMYSSTLAPGSAGTGAGFSKEVSTPAGPANDQSCHSQSKVPNADSTPGAANASTKANVAQNVDKDWLKSVGNAHQDSQNHLDPGFRDRGRCSSTQTTAIRADPHWPGCPAENDPRFRCTCAGKFNTRAGTRPLTPSSPWTNDGWGAPDEPVHGSRDVWADEGSNNGWGYNTNRDGRAERGTAWE
ncbi:uncharacterized protein HMPREF1541_01681 [Cyphellophora europaea CBS 101466]|uniref:Uncharacterized protein n=1 Tax=Cyphellophora europaea (strain CBS 101466) TaxID=1220924 RepID=W2S3K8_CYPE1|nr:uncharacterized protein HMPREF1541_01681 [Cyphellophora europaea CBS 101466]ETN42524.1 hypothetical protein HMPREF1541_01681 [Cyphellophora europaea CBS 101466]